MLDKIMFYLCYVFDKLLVCPVCSFRGWRFSPEGDPPRKNAACPDCHAYERSRLLWAFLGTVPFGLIHGRQRKVLHFGPERALRPRFESMPGIMYHTSDLVGETGGSGIEREDSTFHFDVCDIKLKDNSYDVVICNHIFEHVKEDRKAMAEVFRILRPGGYAILQVPVDINDPDTLEEEWINTADLRAKYYGYAEHVRMYGYVDYPLRLQATGFKVKAIRPSTYLAKYYSPKRVKQFALDPKEIFYFCRKEA